MLTECVRRKDYTTLHVSPLVELLALAAIDNIEALLAPRIEQARRNRELVRRWATDHADLVTLTLPAGGVAAFPRFEGWQSTDAFAQRLLNDFGVLVIPGTCFERPQHIRLGFGGANADLVEGLHRLSAALS